MTTSREPRITIGITCYREGDWLRECWESVVAHFSHVRCPKNDLERGRIFKNENWTVFWACAERASDFQIVLNVVAGAKSPFRRLYFECAESFGAENGFDSVALICATLTDSPNWMRKLRKPRRTIFRSRAGEE